MLRKALDWFSGRERSARERSARERRVWTLVRLHPEGACEVGVFDTKSDAERSAGERPRRDGPQHKLFETVVGKPLSALQSDAGVVGVDVFEIEERARREAEERRLRLAIEAETDRLSSEPVLDLLLKHAAGLELNFVNVNGVSEGDVLRAIVVRDVVIKATVGPSRATINDKLSALRCARELELLSGVLEEECLDDWRSVLVQFVGLNNSNRNVIDRVYEYVTNGPGELSSSSEESSNEESSSEDAS